MPDLRSGTRQTKKVNNVEENPAVLAPTSRRGTRRGKSPKAPFVKSPPVNGPATPASLYPMPRGAGRGRGCRINQDKNVEPFGAGLGGRGRACLDVGVKAPIPVELVVEKTAEKLAAVEEEGNTTPLPERVLLSLLYHLN